MLASQLLVPVYTNRTVDIMAREASAFIQTPFGFAEWSVDHIDNFDALANGGETATLTPLRSGRAGGGKLLVSAAGGQGYSWQNYQQPYPIVASPRDDAWYLAFQGTILALPATGEIMPVGLTHVAAAGGNAQLQIASDSDPPLYVGLIAHGPTSLTNWCFKIYDGGGGTSIIDTGVTLDVGNYNRVALASDGMGTHYLIRNGIVGWSDTDVTGMYTGPGLPQILVRNPGGVTPAEVEFDLHYAAGQRL